MIKYHLRSLLVRRARTLATAAGIGLAVFVAVVMFALARGMATSIQSSGNPLNVLVTSRGAETIEFSALDRAVYEKVRHAPEAALASPEILLAVSHENQGRISQALVRGVQPVAAEVHDQVRIVAGRMPSQGREVAVGPLAAVKLGRRPRELELGEELVLDGLAWKIVGRFEAPGTAFEAEIWAPLDEAMAVFRREELNAIVLRARDAEALEELLFDLDTRRDVIVAARRETDYYAEHAEAFRPISAAMNILAGVLVLGGSLIGMNTLLASVSSRTRELGMLRTLGFRRLQLAVGFAFEGVVPALLGSLLALAAAFCLQGMALRLPMGAFRIDLSLQLAAVGLLLGLVIGLLGSIAAVARILRLSTIEAIRHL